MPALLGRILPTIDIEGAGLEMDDPEPDVRPVPAEATSSYGHPEVSEHPRHPDDLASLGDDELVQLAQASLAGDAAEQETARRCISIVVLRRRDLVRTVIAAKVPPGAIDEVESDVLWRFSTKVYSGAAISNPPGLLVQMAKFARADYLEGRRDGDVSIESWDGAAADADLDAAAVEAAVDELLAPLTDRQREAVWKRVVEGRSSAEVAATLETTPGNIDVIVHRALARMREAAE
jgi:RNA polymerase sigma factor (sigma-70 family)